MSGVWVAIVLAGIGTYAMRASFLVFAHRLADVPPSVQRLLRQIPPAALAAIVIPALLRPGGLHRRLAAAALRRASSPPPSPGAPATSPSPSSSASASSCSSRPSEPRRSTEGYGPAAMSATDAPPADLLDPAWWPDLDRVHDFFTWARREAPVYRDANGYWIVTRHADVLDVERRSDVFSSQGSYRANITARRVEHDRPGRPGAPGAAAAREPAVHPAGGAARTRPFLAEPDRRAASTRSPTPARSRWCTTSPRSCPSRLTADLLGFPEDRWEDIKSWSERLMRTDAMLRDPEAAMGMMSAIMEFNPLLEEISAERKGCPMDDLISVWTEAGYDPMTMMHETGLFIAGGAETTRTVIARGLAVLAEHPDQWEAAAADPSLVPGLVEEVIRWVTPLNNMFRQVTARRPHRRPAGGRGRPGDARLPERQPRRGRVRRAVHLRHPARPEPAPRLRAGHPLLRGRQPGPPRAAPAVRRAHPAVDATCGSSPRPTSSRTSSPARSAASTSPSTLR